MLVLCSLMQPFNMAMLKLLSIIDFLLLLIDKYMGVGWRQGWGGAQAFMFRMDSMVKLPCRVFLILPPCHTEGWIQDYSIMVSYPMSFSSNPWLANHLPPDVTIALILECLFSITIRPNHQHMWTCKLMQQYAVTRKICYYCSHIYRLEC